MQASTLEGNENNTSELKMNTSGEKKTKCSRRYWVNRVEEVDSPKDQADESTASASFHDTYKENISLKEHSEKNDGLKLKEFGKADYKTDCRVDSGNLCSNVLCTNCCDDPAESSYKYVCCCEEKMSFENKEPDRQVSGSSEKKLPAAGVGEKLPVAGVGEKSPAAGVGKKSPVAGVGEKSPAAGVGEKSPAAGVGEKSPATGVKEKSPAAGVGEKSPAAGVGEKSPLSQTYKNVLEEMVGKVSEKEEKKQQKIKSEKQANEVEPTDSKNAVEKDDQKSDSEALPSNWWTANISKANEMKNKKKGTKSTQDDNNSKKNEVSNSNGKNRLVSWWNSKTSTTGKTAAQKDDSKRKSGDSLSKNNPSCLNPSAETNITNSENETSFTKILSLFYSFFAGIVAFLYGLFSRAVTGGDSNTEFLAPESLPNPEVTALIPESLRRRNAAVTVKEKSNVSS